MKLPKLSLRDLFWLVLVCAMCLGWWADRSWLGDEFEKAASQFAEGQYNAEMRELALENAIEREGYSIEREWSGGGNFVVKITKKAE